MKREIMNARWRQIRGKSRMLWAKLTHNNRGRLAGRFDTLVGVFEEKYINTRQRTAREIDERVADYEARWKRIRSRSKSK